jgi:hypothetical protein
MSWSEQNPWRTTMLPSLPPSRRWILMASSSWASVMSWALTSISPSLLTTDCLQIWGKAMVAPPAGFEVSTIVCFCHAFPRYPAPAPVSGPATDPGEGSVEDSPRGGAGPGTFDGGGPAAGRHSRGVACPGGPPAQPGLLPRLPSYVFAAAARGGPERHGAGPASQPGTAGRPGRVGPPRIADGAAPAGVGDPAAGSPGLSAGHVPGPLGEQWQPPFPMVRLPGRP